MAFSQIVTAAGEVALVSSSAMARKPPETLTAAEYRERALRLRENAHGLVDQKAKADMLRIADECDAIAEALAKASKKRPS
jgi:hypothetical protein